MRKINHINKTNKINHLTEHKMHELLYVSGNLHSSKSILKFYKHLQNKQIFFLHKVFWCKSKSYNELQLLAGLLWRIHSVDAVFLRLRTLQFTGVRTLSTKHELMSGLLRQQPSCKLLLLSLGLLRQLLVGWALNIELYLF